MSSSVEKTPSKSLSVQAIVFLEVIFAVISLLFFLLFGVSEPGKPQEGWYLLGTALLEIFAFGAAAILCFRNWLSPQIVSGRKVWLGIGLGMLCFSLGGILFAVWEVAFQREPDVSPGDFLYVLTYLFLGWGMVLAFMDRRLNLEIWQWGVVSAIAAVGIALATWLTLTPEAPQARADWFVIEPVNAQTAPPKTAQKPPTAKPSPKATPSAAPTISPEPVTSEAKPVADDNAPAFVVAIEQLLQPYQKFFSYFYVIADVFILIIASTLLLAFWGGRFSQSWRMIAAAAVSLYIADMWVKYATSSLYKGTYQSGGLLEVFFVFSGVLFGIGAALEFDLSRSRRAGSRRRA
jgi:hypothetical protein